VRIPAVAIQAALMPRAAAVLVTKITAGPGLRHNSSSRMVKVIKVSSVMDLSTPSKIIFRLALVCQHINNLLMGV
jgi:hypothetical protein